MKIIDIGDEGKLNINIPKNKFFDDKNPMSEMVDRITWTGVIKPGIYNVDPFISDSIRYEEIQFLKVIIANRDCLYDIARSIYSQIKYPCVIEFQLDDIVIIGCCKFKAGKLDNTKNVDKQLFFTHPLRTEILSPLAVKMINKINEQVFQANGSIFDIYNKICNAVISYSLSGTTKTHVVRLIRNMLYHAGPSKQKSILQYSTPYKYYPVIYGNRFNGKKDTSYKLIYDYEEIWYCFMKDPDIKRVIDIRRYRDIEDLMFSIDSKSW